MDNKTPQPQQDQTRHTKKRVFISYAREDRARIKQLAASLEGDGVDVWWDIETPPGKRFVDVIADALQTCDYVIVAWSQHSIDSDWVKREAATGLDRDVLLPILLEPMDDLPFLFRDLHACSFIDWHGERQHHDYQNLLEAIRGNGNQPLTNKTPHPIITASTHTAHNTPDDDTDNTKEPTLAPWLFIGFLALAGIATAGFFFSKPDTTLPASPINSADAVTQDTNPPTLPSTLQDENQNKTEADNTPKQPDPTPPTTHNTSNKSPVIPYKVTAQPSLVLRDKPHRSARKIGNAPINSTLYIIGKHGAAISIGDRTGHWVQVTDGKQGKTAYAFDAYLEAYVGYRITAKPSLTLRDKPSHKAKKLAALPTGLTVYPLATASGLQTIGNKNGKWVRIVNEGKTGYIFDAFLKKVD